MKSKFVELGSSDKLAKEHFLVSLSDCADHILSKKLLDYFSLASGPMFAIIGDWFNLDQMTAYNYSMSPPNRSRPESGQRPIERLGAFVAEYLRTSISALVLSENWGSDRRELSEWACPPPQIAYYGDNEVFHVLTPEITDPETIEDAIMPRHHWQTSVCSSCLKMPSKIISDESFLDEIVRNTVYIFIPAFDGSGFLIWSPIL